MGVFSIYTGLIYNDVFSKSLNLFGSSWSVNIPENHIVSETTVGENIMMVDPVGPNGTEMGGYSGYPYPFGVDPVWQISINKIVFLNAFKMKVSIIIGVIHMLFLCIA